MSKSAPSPLARIVNFGASIALVAALAACDPAATPDDEADDPPELDTDCDIPSEQPESGIELDCTIEGDVADVFIDPTNSSNDECTPNSLADAALFTLSDQELNVPVTMIVGAEGDDTPGRLRVDVQVNSGTHTGQFGKTPPSCGDAPINSPVNTGFSGVHRSVIDREATPYCIRFSTYTPSGFTQTLGEAGPGVEFAMRNTTEDIIERRIDLEIARVANGIFNAGVELDDDFVERSGRCDYAHGPFEG